MKKISGLISSFDANAKATPTTKENSSAAVKKFAEENNLYDASIYPAHIAICPALAVWLQKAHNARAAAIAYNLESGNNLEVA